MSKTRRVLIAFGVVVVVTLVLSFLAAILSFSSLEFYGLALILVITFDVIFVPWIIEGTFIWEMWRVSGDRLDDVKKRIKERENKEDD